MKTYTDSAKSQIFHHIMSRVLSYRREYRACRPLLIGNSECPNLPFSDYIRGTARVGLPMQIPQYI